MVTNASSGEAPGPAGEEQRAPEHDVHSIASRAAEFEATVERFLDEAIISDVSSAMSGAAVDETLEIRREQQSRMQRVHERATQLMEEHVAKNRHAQEVRELEEAVSISRRPVSMGKQPAAKQSAAEAPSARRAREPKPYVADLTEFVGQAEADRSIQTLRQENDLLRRCLEDKNRPQAFNAYLKTSTTF